MAQFFDKNLSKSLIVSKSLMNKILVMRNRFLWSLFRLVQVKPQTPLLNQENDSNNEAGKSGDQPTSPKDTSWEQGKGEKIALCLREQHTGKYNFIDKELVKFVAIHELTHIAANTLDHPPYFWKCFRFLLKEANILMGYKLINYALQPVDYCSMTITYNPVFDLTIIDENEPSDITSIS